MRLSTEHPSESCGMPVFVDEDNNQIDYVTAIKQLCKDKGWTYSDLANKTGVSKRTAEGWGQGRMMSKSAILLISHYL